MSARNVISSRPLFPAPTAPPLARTISRALVKSDARALIERFGDKAYLEARHREHDEARVIDGNRTPGREKVKDAIQKRQGRR